MIIKSITIENMKAIRDILHIEFSQDVNLYLLVGKNSSGKSTVLEAIRSACWNPPANVKAEFFSTSKPKVYKVRSTKGIYDYLSSSRPGVLESDFKALLRNYDEEELAKLGESVSRIVSNDIKILSIKKERDRDIKILINGVEIAPQDLSSGIQAILTIEAMLNYPRARTNDLVIFLIEEPEVFLHPNLLKTYARRFLDFAKERKNTQLFISTHSPILLSFVEPHQVIKIEEGKAYYTKDRDFKGWYMMSDPAKAEIFFADRVIMLEGYTDKLVFSGILEGANIRPEEQNVSLIYVDGAYNREMITKICEAFEIKNLFIGDKDQEKHKRRGGSREDLSFEFILPYGEMEDCIPLLDWAMALGEDFISFLLELLSESIKGDAETSSDDASDTEKERLSIVDTLGKALGRNKVRYALRLRDYYAKTPLSKGHPLYPLLKIMDEFIKNGNFTHMNFPEKPDILKELEDFILVFIQKDLQGALEASDICIEDEKVAGVFFDRGLYGKLNRLLVKLTQKGIPFYAVVDYSYDFKAIERLINKECEGVDFDKLDHWLGIKYNKTRSIICKMQRGLEKTDIEDILNLRPLSKN